MRILLRSFKHRFFQIGMKQHFNLGKLVRNLYVDTGFLGKRYSSKEVRLFGGFSPSINSGGPPESLKGRMVACVPYAWPLRSSCTMLLSQNSQYLTKMLEVQATPHHHHWVKFANLHTVMEWQTNYHRST